jgi:hypothetical protein
MSISAKAVVQWAQLAARWYTYELGEDSEYVRGMLNIARYPTMHERWGTREKMVVEGPGNS